MKVKAFCKRYRVLLVLLVINLVVVAVFPEVGLQSFSITKSNILDMLGVIVPIFILLGLLDVWVDRATVMKFTGKGSGLKGILMAFLLGSAAAGPLYAAFPVASIMLKKGSSVFNVLVFIGAWSTTKIAPLTFEAASMGVPFMLTRLVLSVAGILGIAWLTDYVLRPEEKEEMYLINQ